MLAVALQWPLRLRALSLVDEGLVVQVADDLLHGRRLYADAVAYAWPGAFWLTAGVFALAGTSVETARTLALVVFALAIALAYLIARWTLGRFGALVVALVFLAYRVWAYPHWQMVNYSPLAMMWLLAAVWASGEAIARQRMLWAVAAGIMAGLAAISKQDLGLATVGLLGAALALAPAGGGRQRLGGFALGAAAVLGTTLLVLAAQGVLVPWFHETVLAPLYAVQNFEYPARPPLWPLFVQDAGLRARAFSYLPSVLVDLHWSAIVGSRLWRETAVIDAFVKVLFHLPWLLPLAAVPLVLHDLRGRAGGVRDQRFVVLVAAAVAAAVAFNRPHDWVHLLVLYPPTLLVLAALVARGAERGGRVGALVGGAALAIALGLAAGSAWLALGLVRRHDTPVRSARGTLYAPAEQARPVQALLDALGERPRSPLASWPYHPLVNFLADRPPLSRYYILWPVDRHAGRDAEILATLAAHPDADIAYSQMQVPHYPRPQAYAPLLFAHLADAWEVGAVFGGEPGGFTLLHATRRAHPPPGRSLLPELLRAPVQLLPVDGAGEPQPTDAPERLVGEAIWPFHRVLRMATLPGLWTRVALPLLPAAGDRFEVAFGTNPDYLGTIFAPGARFAIRIAADGTEEEVFAASCDPSARASDRSWRQVQVDLAPWHGRAIVLALQVSSLVPVAPERLDVAGWADPRLVSPASASRSAAAQAQRRDVPRALEDVARTELREAAAAIDEDDRYLPQAKPQAMSAVLDLDQERVASAAE